MSWISDEFINDDTITQDFRISTGKVINSISLYMHIGTVSAGSTLTINVKDGSNIISTSELTAAELNEISNGNNFYGYVNVGPLGLQLNGPLTDEIYHTYTIECITSGNTEIDSLGWMKEWEGSHINTLYGTANSDINKSHGFILNTWR